MVRQFRFSIGEACDIVSRARFEPELESLFGPACEDTDWHWVTFELNWEGKSYRIPCVWTSDSKTVSCLTNTYEWFETEAEIYAAVNPGTSAEEIQKIIDLGREILYRASYYHPIIPGEPERPENKPELEPQMPPRPWRGPGLG